MVAKDGTAHDGRNDLQQLNHSMGIMINITMPCVFHPTGADPTDETNDIILYPGWNLVGFASTLGTQIIYDSFYLSGVDCDRVERFNSTSQSMEVLDPDVDIFENGKGYWVHCAEVSPVVWDIP